MNKIVKKFVIFILSITSLILIGCNNESSSNSSKDQKLGLNGDVIGNGGDSVKIEFFTYVELIRTNIKNNSLSNINLLDFEETIKNLNVVVTDDTLFEAGSGIVDAINIPESQTIKINRNRWNTINHENFRKTLVLHEILGLMEIEDKNYIISTQLLGVHSTDFTSESKKIDFVVLVDNSGSMRQYRDKVLSHMFKLLGSLEEKNIDFNLAFVYVGSDQNPIYPPGTLIRMPLDIMPNYYQNFPGFFTNSITAGPDGVGSPTEKYFDILNLLFSDAYLSSINSNFFRESADLNVLIFTDTDDQSDIEASELTMEILKVKNIQSTNLKIIFPTGNNCMVEDSVGLSGPQKLNSLAVLLNGDFIDLCSYRLTDLF